MLPAPMPLFSVSANALVNVDDVNVTCLRNMLDDDDVMQLLTKFMSYGYVMLAPGGPGEVGPWGRQAHDHLLRTLRCATGHGGGLEDQPVRGVCVCVSLGEGQYNVRVVEGWEG